MQEVVGSIPSGSTTINRPKLAVYFFPVFCPHRLEAEDTALSRR